MCCVLTFDRCCGHANKNKTKIIDLEKYFRQHKMSEYRFRVVDGVVQTVKNEKEVSIPSKENKNINYNVESQTFSVSDQSAEAVKHFSSVFAEFKIVISNMQLTHSNTDNIFVYTKKLLECYTIVCDAMFSKCNNSEAGQKQLHEFIHREFKDCETRYKRTQNNKSKGVSPIEKAIGLKWKYSSATATTVPRHYLTEATGCFVSITQQLESLMMDPHFEKVYTDYNAQRNTEKAYSTYATAQNYQNSIFFAENPDAIQIQIATDDCELCDALKTKAGYHKITCGYMQIVNLPPEYLSQLSSIYLILLCYTAHTKKKDESDVDIWEPIVNDLKHLEIHGVRTGTGKILKGTLVNMCYDNLGGNTVYGMTQSFSFGKYVCRHCEADKTQMQSPFLDRNLLRSVQKYDECMRIISESTGKIDTKNTKGFRESSFLNNLDHFHIMENNSLDLMHDFNEGILQYFLHDLFAHITKKKFLTQDELVSLVRDFDYGHFNKDNRPSLLNIDKKNLHQSAAQTYCLVIYVPFILKKIERELIEDGVWHCVRLLQRIMQIVYSNCIQEDDIQLLEQLVPEFLAAIKHKFGAHLKPKHHNALHYADVIRRMGAPKSMWMMRFVFILENIYSRVNLESNICTLSIYRYEAKHKFFTTAAKNANNYINVCKTLSTRHQESMLPPDKVYSDRIEYSKRSNPIYKSSEAVIQAINASELGNNMNTLKTISFLNRNGIEYRTGLMIIIEMELCQIVSIVIHGGNFFLVCKPYDVSEYDSFCNSIVVQESNRAMKLINCVNLGSKFTYELTVCQGKLHIIVETLDLKIFVAPINE